MAHIRGFLALAALPRPVLALTLKAIHDGTDLGAGRTWELLLSAGGNLWVSIADRSFQAVYDESNQRTRARERNIAGNGDQQLRTLAQSEGQKQKPQRIGPLKCLSQLLAQPIKLL